MSHFILRPDLTEEKKKPELWLEKEWLVTNGLGAYASNSLGCIPSRKYHGLLVSSLPKTGRTVMIDHLLEIVQINGGKEIVLNSVEKPDGMIDLQGLKYLEDFYLEKGLPVWRFNFDGTVLEKKILMTHAQNTVHIIYYLVNSDKTIKIRLYPYMHFRPTSENLRVQLEKSYVFTINENRYEIIHDEFPSLKILLGKEANFSLDRHEIKNVFYRKEARRGYPPLGSIWTPGFFEFNLTKEQKEGTFSASTQEWDEILALDPFEALQAEIFRRDLLLRNAPAKVKTKLGNQLILAADDFIITPASRIQDKTRANAAGDEVRTVIAGYHWFNDWGRDTMISLEGLTLCTGREDEARWILRTFAYYVKNGLIPNMFPEGKKEGLYHTADATLWFFHALNSYLEKTADRETLQFIFPKLLEIYRAHIKGTQYGIRVDPTDGLLIQGQEGYQLTWMDAKVENWVVTPRRGKAVEINALWYNALRILEGWLKEESHLHLASEVSQLAEKVYRSFNQKFWNEKRGFLFDVIEGENGNDDSCRPNQLFSISLKHPVLDPIFWKAVFETSKKELFTPVGLRSLSQSHPDFKKSYAGDLHSRDAAYHQGTVWSWLIGPYVDVWLKIYPNETEEVRSMLDNFYDHLKEAGIGFISEIFDAEVPHQPRGCIAQAWSIAEILRCLKRVT